jgi:type VI protein secretion system component VasF
VTSPADDQPPPAHSAASAAQLTRFGASLVAALQDYVVVAAAVRSPDDDASTDDAYARVVQAMAVFDAAHLDHLEYPAPAGDVDDLEFEDDDAAAELVVEDPSS